MLALFHPSIHPHLFQATRPIKTQKIKEHGNTIQKETETDRNDKNMHKTINCN